MVKVMKLSNRFHWFTAISLIGLVNTALAQDAIEPHVEDRLEEVVVTAPFAESEAETALPINILSGEALRERVSNSLGDTLKNEIGIANGSFGTSVGQPVIRGHSGKRVSVLQNGTGLTDASNVSPDHANGVEAVLADRLEILRGPSALLYGSGAIGGVVNVIDGRVPESLEAYPRIFLDQSRNTVNSEDKTVFRFDGSSNQYGFHVDAFSRRNDNVRIKGYAVDEAAVAAMEELAEQQLGIGHEDGHLDKGFNSEGYIANSDSRASGGTLGFSRVGDLGFLGFAVAELDNEYGLPPGTHGHEEEAVVTPAEGFEHIRLDMTQRRYDLRSQLNFPGGFFESLKADIGYTDYEHQEIEVDPSGNATPGTLFSNQGLEGRITLNHRHVGTWAGVWGLQFNSTEFSAIGEEAFIPVTDLNNVGLFAVHRYNQEPYTVEFGLRFENSEVNPVGACSSDENAVSGSVSLLYDLDANSNLLFGLTRSQRAATVEELYSNVSQSSCAPYIDDQDYVLHAATALVEVGNPGLGKETSSNLEFGWRRHRGLVIGELSAYYNRIADYIYVDISGAEIGGRPIAQYRSADATFRGLEAELSLDLGSHFENNLELGIFGDLVRAEFDAGGNVPRIPPAKLGTELRWYGADWSLGLRATRFAKQDQTSAFELPTEAYTLLSLYGDYHLLVGGDSELSFYLRGDNLLDESIRNHASYLKNYAPEAGRGVTLGMRFEY